LVVEPAESYKRVAIWLSEQGKQGLFLDGELRPAVRKLVDAGIGVIGIDLFQQGEFLEAASVANPREAAAYTHGYNNSVFAARVHDALSAVVFAQQRKDVEQVTLVGWQGAGHWAAAARAQAEGTVDAAVIHTDGFRFVNVADIRSPDFLPGGARYDDLLGMIAVAAPQPV
jgi:hypothetical protein